MASQAVDVASTGKVVRLSRTLRIRLETSEGGCILFLAHYIRDF